MKLNVAQSTHCSLCFKNEFIRTTDGVYFVQANLFRRLFFNIIILLLLKVYFDKKKKLHVRNDVYNRQKCK